MKYIKVFLVIVIFVFTACSTSEQASKEDQLNDQEVYVFDEVTPEVETEEIQGEEVQEVTPEPEPETVIPVVQEEPVLREYYVIQLGAFSSRDRAERFVEENQNKIVYQMKVVFREDVNLYAVQIPPYDTKEDAEIVKNQLWQIEPFIDAFIITLMK